jgi:hypothetical protein
MTVWRGPAHSEAEGALAREVFSQDADRATRIAMEVTHEP